MWVCGQAAYILSLQIRRNLRAWKLVVLSLISKLDVYQGKAFRNAGGCKRLMTVDASKGRVCHRRLYSGETRGQTVLGQCVLTRQPRVSAETLASLPIDPTKRPNLDFCQSRDFRQPSSCGLHQTILSPDMDGVQMYIRTQHPPRCED